MSMVDKLRSLYNAATVVLVAAAVWQTPSHALEGTGIIAIKDKHLMTLTWTGPATVLNSTIGRLDNLGSTTIKNTTITSARQVGSIEATETVFVSDVDLTTANSTFNHSQIGGNLLIHNNGNGRVNINLNNTTVMGAVLCDIKPCPVTIN